MKELEDLFNSVKIYKSTTQKSVIDVTSALIYFKNKNNGEKEYQGSVLIGVTDREKGLFENFFLNKDLAKVIFNAFIQGSFDYIFPQGAKDFGMKRINGDVKAKTITITKTQSNQLGFQIDMGPGRVMDSGAVQMIRREKRVIGFAPFVEALKMSHEVLSFIEQAEYLSFSKGFPLYSRKAPYNNNSQNVFQNNQQFQNNFNSIPNNQIPVNPTQPNPMNQQPQGYIIKIGPLKGTPIKNVDSDTLAQIAKGLRNVDLSEQPGGQELLNEIVTELQSRIG